ncbi:MAG: PepSY-associated TM helix domain-containing protein [Pseudomonadota bacterium]
MNGQVITSTRAAESVKAVPSRTLLSWHRWGGLIATLVLFIAALTALPLVYKKHLIRWIVMPGESLPATYDIERMGAELDLLATRVPDIETYLIKAPNPDEPYWMLTGADDHLHAYALGTVEPVGQDHWLFDALVITRELHVELMAGLFGEYLLLIGALIAVALGITGVILWWPARKGFRLRWIFPSRRQFKVQLLMQYHRHSGALSSLIVTLVSLGGALLLWQSLVFPLLPAQPFTAQAQPMQNAADAQPSQLLEHAVAAVPDGWPTYVRLGTEGAAQASVRFRLPGEWHPNGRTSVIFDFVTSEVRVSERSDAASISRRLINQAYPLHAGYGMNEVYLFLVFISAVAMLWLGVTGVISYFRRLGLRKG